jgi:hypothetical protein
LGFAAHRHHAETDKIRSIPAAMREKHARCTKSAIAKWLGRQADPSPHQTRIGVIRTHDQGITSGDEPEE